MPTYDAAIALTGGSLRITRPHPAPAPVDSIVDMLLYELRDGDGSVTSIALQIEAGDPPTPTKATAAPPVPDNGGKTTG